jgi:hypothetical protein
MLLPAFQVTSHFLQCISSDDRERDTHTLVCLKQRSKKHIQIAVIYFLLSRHQKGTLNLCSHHVCSRPQGLYILEVQAQKSWKGRLVGRTTTAASIISKFVYSRIAQITISEQIVSNTSRLFSVEFEIVINLYLYQRPLLWSLSQRVSAARSDFKRIFYEYFMHHGVGLLFFPVR